MSLFDDLEPGRNGDRKRSPADEQEPTTPCAESTLRYQAEARKAEEALLALEAYWWSTDPDFEHKAPILNEYGRALAEQLLSGEVHPSQAVGLMQDRYNTITRAMQDHASIPRTMH